MATANPEHECRRVRSLSPKQTVLLDRFGSISAKRNEALHYLPTLSIDRSDRLAFSVDALEAYAMAWLARQTLEGQPGNLAEVTGARGARILGAIHPA